MDSLITALILLVVSALGTWLKKKAASPGQDTLAAYSFAVVDQALRAHAPASGSEGRRP